MTHCIACTRGPGSSGGGGGAQCNYRGVLHPTPCTLRSAPLTYLLLPALLQAPEALTCNVPLSNSVDIYAFGIMMYEIISGKQAYQGQVSMGGGCSMQQAYQGRPVGARGRGGGGRAGAARPQLPITAQQHTGKDVLAYLCGHPDVSSCHMILLHSLGPVTLNPGPVALNLAPEPWTCGPKPSP